MSPNNTQKLRELYPSIYDQAFVFECGDGWFDYIVLVSSQIVNLLRTVPEESRMRVRVGQLKEKFGELRIHMDGHGALAESAWQSLRDILRNATTDSLTICEVCGRNGKRHNVHGVYAVRCKKHLDEMIFGGRT